MRTWQLKYLLLVIATIFFLTACDGSSGLVSPTKKGPDTSVQPGKDILPYTPPKDGAPLEDFGGGNGGGSGHGGNGGGSGHGGNGGDDGGDQQPVPEPSTLILVGSGVALITLCRRKKLVSEKKDT